MGVTFNLFLYASVSMEDSTDRGSIVKSMFVVDQEELVPYFGIVKFYFSYHSYSTETKVALLGLCYMAQV